MHKQWPHISAGTASCKKLTRCAVGLVRRMWRGCTCGGVGQVPPAHLHPLPAVAQRRSINGQRCGIAILNRISPEVPRPVPLQRVVLHLLMRPSVPTACCCISSNAVSQVHFRVMYTASQLRFGQKYQAEADCKPIPHHALPHQFRWNRLACLVSVALTLRPRLRKVNQGNLLLR